MDDLIHAAKDLLLQAYGNKRHGSHAPTIMQWLNLAAALTSRGVELPDDLHDVLTRSVGSIAAARRPT